MKRGGALTRRTPLRQQALIGRGRRSALKRLEDELDDLWSLVVKTRDGWTCQRTGKVFPPGTRRGLDAAHIWSRGASRLVRWDLDNGVALNSGTHMYYHRHPLAFLTWARQRLGEERFDRLRIRSKTVGRGLVDREATRLYLRAELARLTEKVPV